MATRNLNENHLQRDDGEAIRSSRIKTFNDPGVQEWCDAINYEQFANLKQSWQEAIPVIITSLRKTDQNYLVLVRIPENTPNWLTKGKKVSLGTKEQKKKLIEGNVFALERGSKGAKDSFCLLQVKQREIEKAMTHGREQWLLPFSSGPYNLMRESVLKIMQKIDAPVAKELLTREKITNDTLTVMQGPPGTGKTTTIGELCNELYQQYGRNYDQERTQYSKDNDLNLPKILLTAFTHKACVNLAEKLDELNVPFITINIRGLSRHLREEYDLNHISERILQDMRRTKSSHSFVDWNRHRRTIQRQIVDQIMFIICTSMAAPKRFIMENRPPFHLTIVDEGSQMPLPILAGVVSLAEETIVIGDPIQLPPVVIAPLLEKKEDIRVNPLTHTIYDRIQEQEIEFLDKQFRGRPEIFMLVSGLFYDGQIHTGHYIPHLLDYPVIEFVDTSSYDPQEYNRVNYLEAEICQDLINQLATNISSHPMKIGVITPFYAQAAYLRRFLHSPNSSIQLDIGTVHVAQGRTYDCVFLSLAATTLSPFLNPPKKWTLHLKHQLKVIFQRLKQEAFLIEKLQYPNFLAQLQQIYNRWSEQLELIEEDNREPSNSSLRLRLFKDAEMDFVFDLEENEKLPENDFAPNILNVALSRARYRLVILGHFNTLHHNPLVNLIHSWAEIFGQVQLLD
ncbi:MAG: DEAD/DEAH box helicase [Candidatus Hodarchaeota archaeon]